MRASAKDAWEKTKAFFAQHLEVTMHAILSGEEGTNAFPLVFSDPKEFIRNSPDKRDAIESKAESRDLGLIQMSAGDDPAPIWPRR